MPFLYKIIYSSGAIEIDKNTFLLCLFYYLNIKIGKFQSLSALFLWKLHPIATIFHPCRGVKFSILTSSGGGVSTRLQYWPSLRKS